MPRKKNSTSKATKATASPIVEDKKKWPRWNGESHEGRILVGILTSPSTKHMQAPEIYKKWFDFQKYKPRNFSTTVSRVRKNLLAGKEPYAKVPGEPSVRCTAADYEEYDDEDEDDDEDDGFIEADECGVSNLSSELSAMSVGQGNAVVYFKNEIECMFLVAMWRDKTLSDRITVEVMPPYLSFECYNFFLGPTGRTLEGTFSMPKLWTDVDSRNRRFFTDPDTQELEYGDNHPRTIAQKKVTEQWMGHMYGSSTGFTIKMKPIHLLYKARFVVTKRNKNFSVKYCSRINANVIVIDLEDDSKQKKMSAFAKNDVDVDEVHSTFGSVNRGVTPSLFGGRSVVSLTGTTFAAARAAAAAAGIPSEVEMMSIYEEETVEDDEEEDDELSEDDIIVDRKPSAKKQTPTHPYFTYNNDPHHVSRSTHLNYEHDFNLEIEKQKFLHQALDQFNAAQKLNNTNYNQPNTLLNNIMLNENHNNLNQQWLSINNSPNFTTAASHSMAFGTPVRNVHDPSIVSNIATPNLDEFYLPVNSIFSPNPIAGLVQNGAILINPTTTTSLRTTVTNQTTTLPTEITNTTTTLPTVENNATLESADGNIPLNDKQAPTHDELNWAVESIAGKKKIDAEVALKKKKKEAKDLAQEIMASVNGKKRGAKAQTKKDADHKSVTSTGSYDTMATKRVAKRVYPRRSSRTSNS